MPAGFVGAAEWVEADLRRALPLSRLPKRVDAVVHLASLRFPSPDYGTQELFTVNAGAVAALLEYAGEASARRFVLGSTGGVCGYRPRRISESTPPAPFDAYTMSKWQGETIAWRQTSIPVAIVRYFFPYGPGQEAGIVTRLLSRIRSGEPVLLHGGGRHPRLNPVFVDDACELTRRALDAGTSMTVNCAGPQVATIRELATLIGALDGTSPRFELSADNGIGDMVASLASARRRLRFVPQVRLRDGLAATIATA